MKKTLIALAAVAVAGTAMAQSTVTMSGRLGISYADIDLGVTPVTATSERQGISVTDGHITFSSSEDLGMGLRATASMELRLRGRDDAVAARDATLALSGGFGTVTLGAVEAGNGIMGLAAAGAPVIGQDTTFGGLAVETISRPTNVDFIQYTSPELMKGLRARVMFHDSIGGRPGSVLGGMGSNEGTQDATLVGLAYSAGPIAFNADFTKFGRNAVPGTVLDDRFRISGSYNFGVVRVGAGWERLTTTALTNNRDTDWMLGISAPVGANVVVGATYAERQARPGGTSLDSSGFELGAQYNFSRRTSLQAAYISREFDVAIPAAVTGVRTQLGTETETGLRIRLMHTF